MQLLKFITHCTEIIQIMISSYFSHFVRESANIVVYKFGRYRSAQEHALVYEKYFTDQTSGYFYNITSLTTYVLFTRARK